MLEETILRNCPPMAPIPTGTEPRINKLDHVKAVIFDVYGTLFVSGSGDVGTAAAKNTAEALTRALVVSGFEGELEQAGLIGRELLKTEILEWHRAGHEAGTDCPEVEITKVWKRIIDALRNTEALTTPDVDLDQIRRLALEYECRVNPVFPMPGALETMEQIQERGRVLGIVSNAQFYTPLLLPAFFGRTVEACGFDPDWCIWSFRELKAKPSTALFPKLGQFLREKHNVGLGETLYVGNDMLNDIYCAREAGCKTVLFAGDRRSLRLREKDERCLAIQPDAVITSLPQLLEIF
jgi:putative hydrolase of the HAD superfamily